MNKLEDINNCGASSEFVSSSIPSWQILTAHAQPFSGARDLVFCLKIPLDSLLVWANSGGSGETARMRSSEPSLLEYAISTKFACRGPINFAHNLFSETNDKSMIPEFICPV